MRAFVVPQAPAMVRCVREGVHWTKDPDRLWSEPLRRMGRDERGLLATTAGPGACAAGPALHRIVILRGTGCAVGTPDRIRAVAGLGANSARRASGRAFRRPIDR